MKILVVTNDALGHRMAGPAIRAYRTAEVLHRNGHDVKLFTTGTIEETGAPFAIVRGWTTELAALEAWCDVIVFQGFVMDGQPWLAKSSKVMVVDLYDPFHLEQLEISREVHIHDVRVEVVASTVAVLNEQIARGDFFLCASEKQRDFWLGALAALGRVNPLTYERDTTLRALIDVVAFGVDDVAPKQFAHGIRGAVAGIGTDDEILLWGGGVYNWFDPLTLIRAVAQLAATRPKLRLYFLGMKHPNPELPQMQMASAAMQLADELGITDTHVFFNHDWVPFDRRADWLLDADVGVSTHLDHVETAFSFRTRVLDYFWAGLPTVCTSGDAMEELILRRGAGAVVPPGDVSALAAAIETLLDHPDARKAASAGASEIAADLHWDDVLAPLVAFCAQPQRAPDLLDSETAPRLSAVGRRAAQQRRGVVHAVRSAQRHLRNGRFASVLTAGLRQVRRRITRR